MKSSSLSKGTFVYIAMALLLVVYAALRISNISQAAQKVKSATDTISYVRISKESLWGEKFLAGARPVLFPLVLRSFGNNEEKVAWAQGIFSILSWGVLATAIGFSFHTSFLRLFAFAWILLLSLYRYIIGWDAVLLTESLSLSLMALFIAGWVWLANGGWRWHKVVFVLIIGLLWSFCRDTNAWVIFMTSLFLLLLIILRILEKKYLILVLAFLGIFYLSNLTADVGGRWIFPFQNVLGHRILPNPQAVDFFASCGMPVSPALMELRGDFSERAFYEDPALENYRSWLSENGKLCYMKWLLSHSIESIKEPISEFNTLITLQSIQPYLFSKTFSPVLPARLEYILFPRQQTWFLFVVGSMLVLIALFTKAWKYNKVWWVAIGLNLLIFPHYFITWHGDVMGIYRHVLTVSIQFYLGLWLMLLLVLDRVLSLIRIQEGLLSQSSVRTIEQ